jgi:hypothetical protein
MKNSGSLEETATAPQQMFVLIKCLEETATAPQQTFDLHKMPMAVQEHRARSVRALKPMLSNPLK